MEFKSKFLYALTIFVSMSQAKEPEGPRDLDFDEIRCIELDLQDFGEITRSESDDAIIYRIARKSFKGKNLPAYLMNTLVKNNWYAVAPKNS